ncbi:unnamed protein product [Oncorhynchus mykiss]|uniref:Uncharacterized protein n=1 Tax=Oncorhynchus mykiss TaxID=8022 RepID=A0A060WUF1_ONCMY|nr:unnamed protein product [Oncorhynchus mykiss]
MPKEREKRRKTSKEAGLSGAGIGEGFCKERRTSCKASENCDELCQMTEVRLPEVNAVLAQSSMMEVRRVPQVTITPDGGCSQEMEQEDWADVDGPLRRNMSNSSISSTGSSIESEDDILSDNEKKSKGNITLEHLCEHTGESIPWWTLKNIVVNWPFVGSQRRNLSWVQLAGHKGPPVPTYHQPIMPIWSPPHCCKNVRGTQRCGTELDWASACLWRLCNCHTRHTKPPTIFSDQA